MGNRLQRQENKQDPVPPHNVQFEKTRRTKGQNVSAVPKYEIGESSRSSSKHVTRPQQGSAKRHLVAAIDFGTAFSGYAYAFSDEYEVDPLKIFCKHWQHSNGLSNKAPTSVLFGRDGHVKSFGYDAHSDFATVAHNKDLNNWYFFDRFKTKLFEEENLTVDTMLKDISGKTMKAIDVFSGTIGYMKKDLLDRLKGRDTAGCLPERQIYWVITVPAIWNDKAKQFMRKSAEQAGIPKEQLTLALEPEAASLLCRRLPYFHSATSVSGTKYMILDLGGGTADFTVHKVSKDGKLQDIHEASGGDWGETTVDREFFSVMDSVFGYDKMNLFKQKHPNAMLDLQTDFEIKKRKFEMESNVILKIPAAFVEVYEEASGSIKVEDAIKQSQYHDKIEIRKDKMIFKPELFSTFFEGSISCILNHIQELLQKPGLSDVSTILLVGGYSNSPVVRNRIRVVHPGDSELAILKGAMLFGHEPQGYPLEFVNTNMVLQ